MRILVSANNLAIEIANKHLMERFSGISKDIKK